MPLSVQPRDQKTGFYPSTTWILLLEAGEVLSHSASLFQVPSPPLTPVTLVISIHKTQSGKTSVNASCQLDCTLPFIQSTLMNPYDVLGIGLNIRVHGGGYNT